VREQHLDLLAVAARVRERFCFDEVAGYIACGLVHIAEARTSPDTTGDDAGPQMKACRSPPF
jgi:hypothetical protein